MTFDIIMRNLSPRIILNQYLEESLGPRSYKCQLNFENLFSFLFKKTFRQLNKKNQVKIKLLRQATKIN